MGTRVFSLVGERMSQAAKSGAKKRSSNIPTKRPLMDAMRPYLGSYVTLMVHMDGDKPWQLVPGESHPAGYYCATEKYQFGRLLGMCAERMISSIVAQIANSEDSNDQACPG